MTANAGYHAYATGDVLTAAQVQYNLQNQTVMYFASSAARTTALTGVTVEGMVSYIPANGLEYYNGSAWTTVSNPGDITGVTAGTGISGGGASGTVTVTNDMATTITTKGDLVPGTGSGTYARLAVGTNGQTLVADSTASTGLKWATPAGGVTFAGVSLYSSTSVSAANATATTMTFDSELFDTDAYHSTTTNAGRITIPAGKAGYYLLYGQITFLASSTGGRIATLNKNGSATELTVGAVSNSASAVNDNPEVTSIQYLAVADYIEIKGYQTSGGALNMRGGAYYTSLIAQYLGA